MSWDKQRRSKEERLNAAAALCSGKTVATENIVKLMEAVIHPGDKVVLEATIRSRRPSWRLLWRRSTPRSSTT